MKRKRSSNKSSAPSSLDQRYEQLLAELQRSILSGWTGATSPGESASLEQLSRFADSTDAIVSALKNVYDEQGQKIEKLEVLMYDLEGRQQYVEESLGEEHRATKSKFLTALNGWIAEIDREIAREP